MTTMEDLTGAPLDAFGKPLAVGDRVIHVFKHDSSTLTISEAVVVGRTLKRVKILIKETRHNGVEIPSPSDPKLSSPHTLIKIASS